MENNSNRDSVRAARIKRTAEICGVSPSMVQKVLRTDRTNDKVEIVYFSIVDADNETDNKLKEAVKQLVPFN
jgi:predicted transcriptional regulator